MTDRPLSLHEESPLPRHRSPRQLPIAVGAGLLLVALSACTAGGPARPAARSTDAATASPEATAPVAPGGLVEPDGPPAPSDALRTTVTRHVDGDTLAVAALDTRVRLIGIDTPEVARPDSEGECYGEEASAHLASLLPVGTEVLVAADVEPTDRHGRPLAYLWRADDGLFVNLAMVADGYASVLTVPPNVAHAEVLLAAQADARQAGQGLWAPGACPEEAAVAAPAATTFARCAEARAAGAAPLLRGQPGYRPELDGDGDGIACE